MTARTEQAAIDKPVATARPIPPADTDRCWVVVKADGTDPDDDGYSSPHLRTEADIRHFLSGLGEHPMSQCVPKLLDQPCVTVECACGYRYDEDDEGVIHFEDQAQADEAVKGNGWTVVDGQPACPECTPQAKAVEAWNTQHPVGTPVRYWTGHREGDGKASHTRSAAHVLGGHTAVVWVEGESSCIALTHVQPETTEDR
jgi:hypothetical protein